MRGRAIVEVVVVCSTQWFFDECQNMIRFSLVEFPMHGRFFIEVFGGSMSIFSRDVVVSRSVTGCQS
jgi:hypothetical protein